MTEPSMPTPAHSAWGINTTAVHAGRDDLTDLGVHALPIDLSTTNPLPGVERGGQAYETLATGGRPSAADGTHVYRRLWNPTVGRFEDAVARFEPCTFSGEDTEAVAFGTGMAAIAAVVLSRVKAGRPHVVGIRPLYGGTDHLLEHGLLGTHVTFTDVHGLPAAITEHTGLVVIESPGNPTLELIDISEVARIAGEVPVMVDNTFATSVLQRPLELGAAFSVHSATKYIGGHGDAMGGVVITSSAHAQALRQVRAITGGLLDPMSAFLMHRGLPTMPIRVQHQQANAAALAAWLASQSSVARVFYPGLAACDPHGLVGQGRQMAGGGAMVSIAMGGGFDAAASLASRLRLVLHAVSLGGIDTLIQHPAALTHRPVAAAAKPGQGVLRISVGLEDPEDIIADFAQALA
ncbi:MAG: PLP-dependent aspartate aminotransferase family protein [Actinomycetales bacterium]|nr:PLP-dependent aspartate aminotransferase family protein [Actinomycetales bacterium]